MGLALLVAWVWTARPAEGSFDLKTLRAEAEQYERVAEWEKACEVYGAILQVDRGQVEVRERYLNCIRRYYQVRRHRDLSYRKEVLTQGYPQALKIYAFVLSSLHDTSLDRREATPNRLFQKGLEELRHALADPVFCAENLPGANPADLRAFRAGLASNWGSRRVQTAQQAVNHVREVALSALNTLNLNATAVVMEFTCGACYALDDYTMYLTPAQLRELCESLKGEYVGVGLRLTQQDGKLLISEVQANSPAAELSPPLKEGDVLVSIDRKSTDNLLPDTALALLHGEVGSRVELTVHSPVLGPRTVSLRRRPLFVASVSYYPRPGAVALVEITSFQETTPQELDAALLSLARMDVRGLILDLRGNPGGVFESAIETARRFLPSGVIVSTQALDPKDNTVYSSRNGAALTLPLVVLVDGDTASAAEVLAGALKENRRARLVGQTTYGKGCIQGLLRLPPQSGVASPGGLRITVARFHSPSGQPYSGRGVVPHVIVDRQLMPGSLDPNDRQMEQALLELEALINNVPR